MHVEDHADPSEVSQNKAGTGTATRRMTAFLGEVGARHARQGMHRTQGIAPIWVEQGLRSLREDAVGELDTRIGYRRVAYWVRGPELGNSLPLFTTVQQAGQIGNIRGLTDLYTAAAHGTLERVLKAKPHGS
jgi:hypothetical protein